MTSFDHTTNRGGLVEKLDIWRCGDGCGFHLRAGNVVLTFTVDELEAFLRAAGRCYLGETCGHIKVPAGEPELTDEGARHHEEAGAAELASMLEH